jgi:2-phosphoglycerate kinase
LAEADDVVTALRALTTPTQAPELHFWDTHPEARAWTPERIAEQHFVLIAALQPGLQAVISDHVEYEAPVVMEGDYIVPDLAVGFEGAVRAMVISEPDEERLVRNFLAREPDAQAQRLRARVSAVVEAELTRRATAIGAPVVRAWPWDDGLERVDRALRSWEAKVDPR